MNIVSCWVDLVESKSDLLLGRSERMFLEKFPVEGAYGNYQITLQEKYVALDMYEIVAKVKVKRKYKKFYQKDFKEIHRYSSGWSGYNKWIVNLVGLAKLAVQDYEDTIRHEEDKADALKDFANWNGKSTE